MIQGIEDQKSDAGLPAEGFLYLDPASYQFRKERGIAMFGFLTFGTTLALTDLAVKKEIEARHNVTIEKIESDFSKIYCNCKLLLLPSQEAEGLGRGSVEASLNSVPILASNNGGIPEAVKINDFLIFDYSNYASWRNALEKLFDPTIFAIHCQKALETAIAYERRYLNNSFSEYIDSILGQKKRYKSLNN